MTRPLKTDLPFLHPRGWHKDPRLKIDFDQFHIFLWKNSDRFGRCRLTLSEIADRLDLTHPRVKKYFRKMQADKRVKAFGNIVVVADPSLWGLDRDVLDSVVTLPGKDRRSSSG